MPANIINKSAFFTIIFCLVKEKASKEIIIFEKKKICLLNCDTAVSLTLLKFLALGGRPRGDAKLERSQGYLT